MALSLQKASLWKRISAFLFDIILTITLAVGIAFAVSAILGYDAIEAELAACTAKYEEQYGVSFEISNEEFEKLTEEQKAERDKLLQEVATAITKDADYIRLSNMLFYMTLAIAGTSAFLAVLIWQFLIPLLFGYGQTLGKKIFGICVMRTGHVKATNPVLFIRAMVGVYAIETMFPVLIVIMIVFGALGVVGLFTLLLFLGLELFVMITTKTNSAVHDLLCDTVVVDFAGQMIFDCEADRDRFLEEEKNSVLDSSDRV